MIERIKSALNNSVLWFIALIGAALYFWKKEKDLEYELAEEKADATIKTDDQAVQQADHAASSSADDYQSLRDAYLRGHKDDT